MNAPPGDLTVSRILVAAESLFAQHGYEGTTVRQITKQAQVNLAAINYHFGDKQSLYEAVVSRRMKPIDDIRLENLNRAEVEAGEKPVALALIVEIMARPLFELGKDTLRAGDQAAKLIGRSLSEPLPFRETHLIKSFQPTMARFGQALRRHAVALSPEDFLWRLSFVVGAMHHTLATMHRMKVLTRGICRDDDFEGALERFVSFAVVCLQSPARP